MLRERCKKFLDTFQIPTTKFCRAIGLSTSAYYQWRRCELELSEETSRRVSNYLASHGY